MPEPKNTGKNSELIFEHFIEKSGGFIYRFEDLYDAKRRGKATNSKPSDYLVTLDSETSYSEVKSTIKSVFQFSGIQPSQWRTAIKQTRAGGAYYFYIHFITTNQWFKVPARVIIDSAKKSITIKEVKDYEITIIS